MTILSSTDITSLDAGARFTVEGQEYIKHNDRTLRRGCQGCGKKDGLYWAHPVGGTTGNYCAEHAAKGWVLVNRDGRPHRDTCASPKTYTPKPGSWAAKSSQPQPTATPSQEQPVTSAPVIAAVNGSGEVTESASLPLGLPPVNVPLPNLGNDDERIKLIMELLTKPTVTAEQVRDLVKSAVEERDSLLLEMVGEIISEAKQSLYAPLTVTFEQPDAKPPVTIDGAHKDLVRIVKAMRRKKNIFMVGMAGTGKTTLAAHAAEALGVPFYDISLSPDAGRHLLMGYQTADGTFIPTALYEAFKGGGVFHFDECDNSNPGLITVVNQILSHGYIRFADGKQVTKHHDFYAMASGNTYGNGPTANYVGRQPLDGAFKNRWIMVPIRVDEAVEEAMCHATGAPAKVVTEVLRYVRALRASATEQNLNLLYTPRNSQNMCDLYMAEWSAEEIVESAVRMGATDTDWRKVHKQDTSDAIREFRLLDL